MKINKKLLVIFFLIIIIILILIVVKSYLDYSLYEISDLIDRSNEIPNNIYIKEEIHDELWAPEEKTTYEIYVKNDTIYTKEIYLNQLKEDFINYESIWNYKDKKQIHINNISKEIDVFLIQGNGKENPLTDILIGFSRNLKNTQDNYKYYGKEKINGKKYIKFSLTDEENKLQKIYYIDIDDKTVAKIEFYKKTDDKFHLWSTSTYTYNYGTVTDNDILDFDINNYPDYKYNQLEF